MKKIEKLKELKEIERIFINICDDFFDDNCVPEGEKQETYIYVEDHEISHETRKECLEILFNYIKSNIELTDVIYNITFHDTQNDYDDESVKKCIDAYGKDFFFKRWEIQLKNLTHERLELLIEELNKANLNYKNIPFNVYSES